MSRRVFAATLVLVLALLGGSSVSASCLIGLCATAPEVASAAEPAETGMASGHCDFHSGPGYRPAPGGPRAFEDCCASLMDDQELPAAPTKRLAPVVSADGSAGEVGHESLPTTGSPPLTVAARPGPPPDLLTLHAAFLI